MTNIRENVEQDSGMETLKESGSFNHNLGNPAFNDDYKTMKARCSEASSKDNTNSWLPPFSSGEETAGDSDNKQAQKSAGGRGDGKTAGEAEPSGAERYDVPKRDLKPLVEEVAKTGRLSQSLKKDLDYGLVDQETVEDLNKQLKESGHRLSLETTADGLKLWLKKDGKTVESAESNTGNAKQRAEQIDQKDREDYKLTLWPLEFSTKGLADQIRTNKELPEGLKKALEQGNIQQSDVEQMNALLKDSGQRLKLEATDKGLKLSLVEGGKTTDMDSSETQAARYTSKRIREVESETKKAMEILNGPYDGKLSCEQKLSDLFRNCNNPVELLKQVQTKLQEEGSEAKLSFYYTEAGRVDGVRLERNLKPIPLPPIKEEAPHLEPLPAPNPPIIREEIKVWGGSRQSEPVNTPPEKYKK